jgi:hypothetical protein
MDLKLGKHSYLQSATHVCKRRCAELSPVWYSSLGFRFDPCGRAKPAKRTSCRNRKAHPTMRKTVNFPVENSPIWETNRK